MSVAHVLRPLADDQENGRTWCGGGGPLDAKLLGVDHALASAMSNSSIRPCSKCLSAVVRFIGKKEADNGCRG